MTPEDIGDIFQALEDALFAMAIRNMDAHKNWEKDEGFKWTQWQAVQIKGLREYREKVNIMTNKGFDEAKKAVEEFLQEAYEDSVDDATGLAVKAGKGYGRPGFFGVNSDKMNIILDEAVKDIDTKRYACINRMNSGYTDFLRKADIFAQSGSMTIPQALDYAMKDFLSAGLNCVEYSNGNRVNIASYAEMALRTSSSEVTRQANGDVRNALDEYLVVSNVIGMTCPICQKWQGKVLIDDVYSDGKPDGKHLLVSDAKADGFMHPNCRHQLFMYIEGITEIADLPNDVETKEHYKAEQEQRRQEREIRKYKRLRDGAVDPADRQKYDARVKEWTAKYDQFLKERPYLRKNPKRLAPGYTGNGKPMAKVDPKVLPVKELTQGRPLTAEMKKELEEYAKTKNVNIYGLNRFDGDPELLKEQLDEISEYQKDYPRVFEGKRVTISFSDMIPDGTFASTQGKTITYNKFYLRNRAITEKEMANGNMFSNTHMAGIARHEMGHVVESVYGSKGLQFARKSYYNIYGNHIDDATLKKFLRKTISSYSVPDRINEKGIVFTDWNELTSEIMASDNASEFVDVFLSLWREEGLK